MRVAEENSAIMETLMAYALVILNTHDNDT